MAFKAIYPAKRTSDKRTGGRRSKSKGRGRNRSRNRSRSGRGSRT